MSYEILTVRSLGDGKDDALYPAPKFPPSGPLVERDPGSIPVRSGDLSHR